MILLLIVLWLLTTLLTGSLFEISAKDPEGITNQRLKEVKAVLKLSKKTHADLLKKWQTDPEFVKAYDDLADEFALLDEAIKFRKEQNLTQSEIASRMGLPRSAVCRLENGLISGKMPTLPMLRRYAKAIGKRVEVRLVWFIEIP